MITVDHEVLALADKLIESLQLVSLQRPVKDNNANLRIAIGATVKEFCDKRVRAAVADQAKHHVSSESD